MSIVESNKLYSLLQQLSNVPNGSNEAFVLDYKIIQGFTCVISSKKLLLEGIGKKIISADTTNKNTWLGFSVSPIGTVESGVFHLIALGVSRNEQEEDFAFMFQAIKNWTFEIFNVQIDPQIVLCNANKSISNAFLSVFGNNSLVLTCWCHVKQTIERILKKFFAKEIQQNVLNDINQMQLSTSPETFEDVSKFFLQKYAAHEAFVLHFECKWLHEYRNWYVGAAKENPRTNNAIEAFNRSLKQDKMLQEPSSVENFLKKLFELIFSLSQKYDVVVV